MSAIAGAVLVDGRDMTETLLGAIADAGMRRGADGVTRWHGGPAGLIRVAHATTPEAVGEIQPLVGAPSGMVICFDGRLDNRANCSLCSGRAARRWRRPPTVPSRSPCSRRGATRW